MKHLLTLGLLLGSGAALAQSPITITAAQFPATASNGERFQRAALAGFSAPTPGPNQSWDYRGLTAQGNPTTASYNPVAPPLPFAGSVRSYGFTSTLGVTVLAYEGFDAGGFGQLGSVLAAQTIPLAAATGGANDVLTIPAQTVAVGNLFVPLPLASTTRVGRVTRTVTRFALTVQGAGLSQAPAQNAQPGVSVDSVAGWGTLRLPVAGSAAGSAPIPVLLVRRYRVLQDSFYVNGRPMPPAVLASLGLTQGRTSTVIQDRFYRQNGAQSLLTVNYTDRSFGTPASVFYSAERGLPLGTRDAALAAQVGLYPNPARSAFALTVPAGPLATATATLLNALGQVVQSRPLGLPATGGTASFDVRGLPAGVYSLQLLSGETLVVKRVVVE